MSDFAHVRVSHVCKVYVLRVPSVGVCLYTVVVAFSPSNFHR
jgi:hypothetical protein